MLLLNGMYIIQYILSYFYNTVENTITLREICLQVGQPELSNVDFQFSTLPTMHNGQLDKISIIVLK